MINFNKNTPAPAQLGFIGSITFCGSYVKDDRVTKVMTFETMVDWMRSCHDYFTEMVRCGDYDGSEIFVDVYEYTGGQIEDALQFEKVIDQFVIDNT